MTAPANQSLATTTRAGLMSPGDKAAAAALAAQVAAAAAQAAYLLCLSM